jgi:hypothetical protein
MKITAVKPYIVYVESRRPKIELRPVNCPTCQKSPYQR